MHIRSLERASRWSCGLNQSRGRIRTSDCETVAPTVVCKLPNPTPDPTLPVLAFALSFAALHMASFASTSFNVLLFMCQNVRVNDGQSMRCLSTSIILLLPSLPLPSPVVKMYHAGNTNITSSATGWPKTKVHYFLFSLEESKFSTISRGTKDFGYSYPETAALKYSTSQAEKGDHVKKIGKTYDPLHKNVPVQGTDFLSIASLGTLWVPGIQPGENRNTIVPAPSGIKSQTD